MKFSGSYTFAAPAARVWALLMDPQALKDCIPNCQSLTQVGNGQYDAVLIGPRVAFVTTRLKATVSFSQLAPHQSNRMAIQAQGAMGAGGQGEALVTLIEQGEQTTVRVEGDAQASGAAALAGQARMEAAAQSLFQQFFTCLQESLK